MGRGYGQDARDGRPPCDTETPGACVSEPEDQKPEVLSKEEADKVLQTVKATRAERDAAKRELDELKSQLAAAKAADEEAKALQKGDYEKLKTNLDAQMATLKSERDSAHNSFKEYVIKAEIRSALAAHKGNQHLEKLVADQFEAVIGPDGPKVLVKGDPSKTPTQFIESLKTDASYGAFFEGSGTTGGGAAAPGKATTSSKSLSRSHFTSLDPTSQMAHIKAGGSVTD